MKLYGITQQQISSINFFYIYNELCDKGCYACNCLIFKNLILKQSYYAFDCACCFHSHVYSFDIAKRENISIALTECILI